VHFYFAYGSNMNPQRVAERGLRVGEPRAGVLCDFRLTFNKMSRDHPGVGHANIQFARGHRTEGVLYELHHADEILKMDPFESAPRNYGRDKVLIQSASGPCWAWTYFANPAVQVEGLLPSPEYLAHLLAGRPFLSDAYMAELLAWAERIAQ